MKNDSALIILTPPILVPTQVPVGALMFSSQLAASGISAILYDASIEYFHYLLSDSPDSAKCKTADSSMKRRACRAAHYFQNTRYFNAQHHRTHVNNLYRFISRWSAQFEDWRVGLTDIAFNPIPPHDPEQYVKHILNGGVTPFTEYIHSRLIPSLKFYAIKNIAVSLTYLSQIYFTLELGIALQALQIKPVIGGALINVLDKKLGKPFNFNGLYDREHPLIPGSIHECNNSSLKWPELAMPLDMYFTPVPIIPFPLSRGCYWNQCSFCPDASSRFFTLNIKNLTQFLSAALEVTACGEIVFNICDSAIPLAQLNKIMPFFKEINAQFYGFLRFEKPLLNADYIENIKACGGELLQFGLESGSQRILELYRKGVNLKHAEKIMDLTHQFDIKNYVYLLFGLPTESEFDRQATLQFVRNNHRAIDFLNISIFNLPTDCELLKNPLLYDIILTEQSKYRKPLQLYAPFTGSRDSVRIAARSFIQNQLEKDELIRPTVLNTPSRLRIDHAIFFNRRDVKFGVQALA